MADHKVGKVRRFFLLVVGADPNMTGFTVAASGGYVLELYRLLSALNCI